MDPISLIAAALAAGAAAAAKDAAGQAATDAYLGLKAALRRLLGGRPKPQAAVEQYTHVVESGVAVPSDEPVRQALADAGAGDDAEIVAAAQRVLQHVDPEGAAHGKYRVTVGNVQGQVVGDHATVTMHFDTPPPQ